MGNDGEDEHDARFEALFDAFHKAVEEGDVEAEERLGVEALALAGVWAETNMSEDLQLKMLASQFEDEGKWSEAEAARKRVLRIAEADESLARDSMIYKAHDELRGLYQFLGRKELALEHARTAVVAARRADMKILLGMALYPLIWAEAAVNNEEAALEIADEMVALSENDRSLELIRAQALVARAGCFVRSGNLEAAERDLDAACPILTPKSGATLLAGVQSCLAVWWDQKAAVEQARGNSDAATQALGSAVAFRRNVAMAPQLAGPYARVRLARTLGRYAEALQSGGQSDAAHQARSESDEMLKGINLPDGGI